MLDVTSESTIWEEVKAAREQTRLFTEGLAQMVREYHGAGYRTDEASSFAPENTALEYCAVMLPQIVWNNPRVGIKSRRQGAVQAVAEACQHGLNRWCRDVSLGTFLLDYPALDACFAFGVVMIANAPVDGAVEIDGVGGFGDHGKPEKGVPWRPEVSRINPELYFEDPVAETREAVRLQGHTWFIDKDDLIEMAEADSDGGWDLEAIRGLSPDTGISEFRKRTLAHTPKRDELTIHTVWVQEAQPDDDLGPEEGFHGALVTLAEGLSSATGSDGAAPSNGKQIRKPQPYYGPESGPYQVFGYFKVPNQALPLGPIAAVKAQVDEVNDHAAAVMKSDRLYKKGLVVDATETSIKKKLTDMEPDEILAISGFSKDKAFPIEVAGSTPQMRENMLWARERMDRQLGMDEAQRGRTKGADTATEVAVADTASRTRVSLLQRRFRTDTEALLKKVLWYLYHDNNVVFSLGEPDGEQEWVMPDGSEVPDPMFYGGVYTEEEEGSFNSLELDIDVHSMPRLSDQTVMAQVADADAFVGGIVPMLPQMPWLRVDKYLKWREDMLNSANMRSWVDLDMLAEMTGAMIGDMQATPELMQKGKPKPGAQELMGGASRPSVGLQQNSPAGKGASGGGFQQVAGGPKQGVA